MKPPEWAEMEAVAHTLAYDGIIMGDTMSGKPLPAGRVERWAAWQKPTLVIVGSESEAFFYKGTQALADVLLNAKHQVLEGQAHDVSPQALAPVLVEFFNAA
jgi:hypothetical protein